MACTAFCGDLVEVTVGAECDVGNTACGKEWTIEASMETYDITDGWETVGDWKTFCAGMKEWGGSWRGAPSCDTDCMLACDVIGTTCTATFTMAACAISGTILITGITVNAVYQGISEYTVTFKGVGAPTCPGDGA